METSRMVAIGRLVGIIAGALLVMSGVVVACLGLSGSITWIITLPTGISSKLVNAGPGIVMLIAGVILLIVYRTSYEKSETRPRESGSRATLTERITRPSGKKNSLRKRGDFKKPRSRGSSDHGS